LVEAQRAALVAHDAEAALVQLAVVMRAEQRTSTSMRYESAFICRTRRPIAASSSSTLRSLVEV